MRRCRYLAAPAHTSPSEGPGVLPRRRPHTSRTIVSTDDCLPGSRSKSVCVTFPPLMAVDPELQMSLTTFSWFDISLEAASICPSTSALLRLHEGSCQVRGLACPRWTLGCAQRGTWPRLPTPALLPLPLARIALSPMPFWSCSREDDHTPRVASHPQLLHVWDPISSDASVKSAPLSRLEDLD